jgi:hypothetical protein
MRMPSLREAACYVLLQLGDGTILGRRVFSAQMIAELHRPEIAVGSDWTPAACIQNLPYALGWPIADVREMHVVSQWRRTRVSALRSLWFLPSRQA